MGLGLVRTGTYEVEVGVRDDVGDRRLSILLAGRPSAATSCLRFPPGKRRAARPCAHDRAARVLSRGMRDAGR